jgi:hypothetical protein
MHNNIQQNLFLQVRLHRRSRLQDGGRGDQEVAARSQGRPGKVAEAQGEDQDP